MMVGVASDLFAMVYVAKEHKVYVLNSSGTAPSGATLEHLNELGYRWDAHDWGPFSGMPIFGILSVTVPGTVWGWDALEKHFEEMVHTWTAASSGADLPKYRTGAHLWKRQRATACRCYQEP
jgi:gamma-glutamyltranspeptidase